jgi:uncharacterized damage-inducible protein DinB
MLDKSIYPQAPAYYHYYFDLVESNDLVLELRKNNTSIAYFIEQIPNEKWHFAYADGKWTVAEVIRHMIETERIFAYRSLRFSRMDSTPNPGFDENAFIHNLQSISFSKEQLLREFNTVREATLSLFESMKPEMLHFNGNANGQSVTAEMLGFMIVGHGIHHANVIGARYLI